MTPGAGPAPGRDPGRVPGPDRGRVPSSDPGPDRIELRGLRAVGRHGVLPEEQARSQPFEVNLDVELDLGPAVATDNVADTVDYGAIAEIAGRIVATESFQLLESLASRIVDAVMADDRVQAVTVVVRKLHPPVAGDLGSAGVRLSRRR